MMRGRTTMNKKIVHISTVVALVFLAFALSAGTQDQAAERITQLGTKLERQGWAQDAGMANGGVMRSKEASEYFVIMYGGMTYLHAAAADNDARGISIDVFDETGKNVGSGKDANTVSVQVKPATTGPFRVVVSMRDCPAASGCFWGSIVATKP